jgi:hypothetical protein
VKLPLPSSVSLTCYPLGPKDQHCFSQYPLNPSPCMLYVQAVYCTEVPRQLRPPLAKVKVKGKVHPIIVHEEPEKEQAYNSTLSLTLVLDGVGGKHQAPVALRPGNTRYPL